MAPPKKPWFRFYTEALGDRKLRRLTPETRWLFVACLGAARMSPSPGVLLVSGDEPMGHADLADIACMSERAVEKGMAALIAAGLVACRDDDTWFLPKWHERQFESDVSTDRTRKHRSMERPIDVPGTHQNTETEAEAEETTSATSPTAPAPAAAPRADVDDVGFEEFWNQYPRRNGTRVGKQAARKAWARISSSKRPDVMRALDTYATNCGDMPKDAERWLRPGVWDEWLRDDVIATSTPAADERKTRIRDGIPEVWVAGSGWARDHRNPTPGDWED